MRAIERQFLQRALDGEPGAMRAVVRQATSPNQIDLRCKPEMRAAADGTGGTRLLFTGYASVVEQPFEMWDWLGTYTEEMADGCFTKTLSESPDVIFCVNHDWSGVPMARTGPGTLRLSADTTGLLTEADIDGSRSDVYQLQSAMEGGELDAMSFAFWVVEQKWSPDFDYRRITEVDMDGGDTSVVTWPANPATTGTTDLRKRQARALLRTSVPGLIAERVRAEKRAGKALSASTMDVLQQVLDLIADADVGLDAAQPLLAELMGVDNPDADDTNTETETENETQSAGMSLDLLRLREDPALRF